MASAWISCKLTAADDIVIAGQLQDLAAALHAERLLLASEIQDTISDQKRKLEDANKYHKLQTRDAKKLRAIATPQSRGPSDIRRDSRSCVSFVVSLEYLSRVEAASRTILNHSLFCDMIDKLPMDITGIPENHSGVQAGCA